MRKGFTLIEVMVAVMIISVVILGLVQLFANNTHIFFQLDKKVHHNHYLSVLFATQEYGFKDKTTTMYELLSDFEMEDDLKHSLKNMKVDVLYQELEVVDLRKFQTQKEEIKSDMVFEIGKSILKFEETSVSLMRIKLQ